MGYKLHGAKLKLRTVQELCQLGHSRLPVDGSPGQGHPVLEGMFPWPQGVSVCRRENVLVPGLCGRGLSKPGTEGVASGTEPLQAELNQI